MSPLASYRHPEDPVLLGPAGSISAALFFEQARDLAGALPDRSHVINLCESRAGFMLGFAAALMRGQTSLLPSGRGHGDRMHVLRQFPDAYLLTDKPQEDGNCFNLGPFLAHRNAASLNIPQVAGGGNVAILFTSGSTGQPVAHAKTWNQLWSGAAHLAASLDCQQPAGCAVVGSVAPQHMFGLEATVMLPWYLGIPVHAQQPLLPADLEIALRQCGRPVWWMTTPMHLRAALQAPAALAPLAGVVSSTMRLARAAATAAEATWKVPVLEIYGSTETGALALRRTAHEAEWTPLAGVSMRPAMDGAEPGLWAAGTHVGAPVRLDDAIDLLPNGRFLWLGRASDLIKVGGRRASLAALTASLVEIPGIEDGVFVFPEARHADPAQDDAHPAPRLAAVYVSATLAPQDVLDLLRRQVDAAFLPRPLYRVARLPRNTLGKLAQADLVALLAACKLATGNAARQQCTDDPPRMAIPSGHPSLAGHFPHQPIVPGVVMLACVMKCATAQWPQIELGILSRMRFHSPLAPGCDFHVTSRLDGAHLRFEVRLSDLSPESPDGLIASGQWACRPRRSAGDGGA
jgi:acyl-CoA synthetase (AMP-forming)/AMP-acid ligase II